MRIKKKRIRRRKRKSLLCRTCIHNINRICLLKLTPKNNSCPYQHNKESHYQMKQSDIKLFRTAISENNNNICPICLIEMTDDIVLDHHHKKRIKGSGLIRGAICRTCNVFVAKSENNATRYKISTDKLPNVLRRIADYLEKLPYPYIHPSEKPPTPLLKKTSYSKLLKIHNQHLAKPFFSGGMRKLPDFPKSGKLTKKLGEAFKVYNLEPEYYKK